jgi:broad specificity phosphatase PhoE
VLVVVYLVNGMCKEALMFRHGQSTGNIPEGETVFDLEGNFFLSKGKQLSGWDGASLTMEGLAQAFQAGGTARREHGWLQEALWVVSPQRRTRQTFAAIAAGAGLNMGSLNLVFDNRIRERSAGNLQSLTWPAAAERWPEMAKGGNASVFHDVDATYPGGESLRMVFERATQAFDQHLMLSNRLVVVSHEMTLKALLSGLLDNEGFGNSAFSRTVSNAEPIWVSRSAGQWSLQIA